MACLAGHIVGGGDGHRGRSTLRFTGRGRDEPPPGCCSLSQVMGSLIKKRRKRMRKKKHKKMLKATRWQRRAAGK
jgi:hypothetical protein